MLLQSYNIYVYIFCFVASRIIGLNLSDPGAWSLETPLSQLQTLLSSGRRYQTLRWRENTCFSRNFVSSAIAVHNSFPCSSEECIHYVGIFLSACIGYVLCSNVYGLDEQVCLWGQ